MISWESACRILDYWSYGDARQLGFGEDYYIKELNLLLIVHQDNNNNNNNNNNNMSFSLKLW